MTDNSKGYVYVLRLENNKWYVGWTTDVERRYRQHCDGIGAQWTMLHKPIEIQYVKEGDIGVENKMTISLMGKHGWENVRGGFWCSVHYDSDPLKCPKTRNKFKSKPKPKKSIPSTDYGNVYVMLLKDGSRFCGFNSRHSTVDQMVAAGDLPQYVRETGIESTLKEIGGTRSTCKELTLKLMAKYGWENVRGYAWSQKIRKSPPLELDRYK